MAEVTAPKVPEVPAPAVETYPDGSPIKKGAASTEFWPSQEKAEAIAKGRQKGARLAFTVKDPSGKVRFATSTHHHFLEEHILCTELGWSIDQVGKPPSAKAPQSADSMLAALSNFPEAERELLRKKLMDELKIDLTAKKK